MQLYVKIFVLIFTRQESIKAEQRNNYDADIEKLKASDNVDFSRCRRKRAKNDPYIRAYADMNLPAPVKYCEDFMRSTNHFISLDVL